MELKQRISIDIAGRPYFFTVKSETEEEHIRKAGKQIGEKLLQYKSRFSDKDVQDLLAFIALQFATKTIELESRAASTQKVDKARLEKISEQLDAFLSECNDC
jgi:cell division protein ZapA